MISKQLLDILCCPKCHGDLIHDEPGQKLTCKSCGHIYRNKDDIPIMLIDEKPSDPKDHAPGS